jgi:hypothetical protein
VISSSGVGRKTHSLDKLVVLLQCSLVAESLNNKTVPEGSGKTGIGMSQKKSCMVNFTLVPERPEVYASRQDIARPDHRMHCSISTFRIRSVHSFGPACERRVCSGVWKDDGPNTCGRGAITKPPAQVQAVVEGAGHPKCASPSMDGAVPVNESMYRMVTVSHGSTVGCRSIRCSITFVDDQCFTSTRL